MNIIQKFKQQSCFMQIVCFILLFVVCLFLLFFGISMVGAYLGITGR